MQRSNRLPELRSKTECNQAANLVDRVLPNIPFRQWTLVVPYELRYAMAARSDVLVRSSPSSTARCFVMVLCSLLAFIMDPRLS